ncbi:unnamed protein product, partial [Adineta steineri]
MTERDTDIFCSFCNELFTSTEDIGNHLMMCGNKTDPCPRCNQFIRRAIFAYHYENNCAILDEITTRDKTYQTSQNSDQPYQFNNLDDDDDDDGNILIPSEYCYKGISWEHYEKHIKACQNEEHERLQRKSTTNTGATPCKF